MSKAYHIKRSKKKISNKRRKLRGQPMLIIVIIIIMIVNTYWCLLRPPFETKTLKMPLVNPHID